MSADALPLVVLTHPFPPDWFALLDGRVRLRVGPGGADGWPAALDDALPQAEGLLSTVSVPVDDALLARAPRLRVVSNIAVGLNNIDLAACARRGIAVGHTPGLLTDATADLTMALLLSAARRLPEAAASAASGGWTHWEPAGWLGVELRHATVGIVGLGRIGQAVARRLRPFGARLVTHTRTRRPEAEAALEAQWLPLGDLLAVSDIVVLLVPLTDATRHLIAAAELRRMKPGALLINVARGPVVDTAALTTALREGWIGAAALDVTEPEPLPAGHPLYALPNCLIVPHIGSATGEARRGMARLAAENLLAGLAGRPLPHQAHQAAGSASA